MNFYVFGARVGVMARDIFRGELLCVVRTPTGIYFLLRVLRVLPAGISFLLGAIVLGTYSCQWGTRTFVL